MQLKADYSLHDQTYQKLKATGFSGWGGANLPIRMQAWGEAIQDLMAHPQFPQPPAELLELGSGAGDLSMQFAKLGYHVTGVEISGTGVQWAQEKAKKLNHTARFYQGSVCDLSRFKDESFDVAIDGNCLHCIIGSDRQDFYREAQRVLIPGGILYISSMMGILKKPIDGISFDPETRCQYKNGAAYRYMAKRDELLAEITAGGFEVLEARNATNPWWDHLSVIAKKA